jgi:fumarylacetoacetate (FAA) hydrolase
MFHPVAMPMERGWVGRVEGDEVVHLAAQTLQHVFTGGGKARDHARYPLAEVTLLAPLAVPPSIRVFDADGRFEFANPAALVGPGAVISAPDATIALDAGLAGLVGLDGVVAVSPVARLRAPALAPPKDRDFGIVLGPWFTTLDEAPGAPSVRVTAGGAATEATASDVDWETARRFAAANTRLRVGDLLLAPAAVTADTPPGEAVVDVAGLGRLELAVESA